MNSFKILQLILPILVIHPDLIHAQQSILLNQSAYNLFVISPAAIGLNNELNANCHYKKNWLGLSESPESIRFTIDGSLSKEKHGLGLSVHNEKAGIFSKTYLAGTYRYKIKLDKNQNILFGLSVGFQKQQSDFSKIKADSPEEFALWPQQQSTTIPDAAFGIVYTINKLIFTGSAAQVLNHDYTYKEPVYNTNLSFQMIPQFIFSIQNTFQIRSNVWKYTPLLILRTTQGLPFQIDVVNTLLFKDKLILGIGYRYLYATYVNLGFMVSDKLRIIYSYEYSFEIQSTAKGGHEVGLKFGFAGSNKKSLMQNTLTENNLEEIFIKLDQQDQQIDILTQKVDTLDKNTKEIKSQITHLKSVQLDPLDIKLVIEEYIKQNGRESNEEKLKEVTQTKSTNTVKTTSKYKVISAKPGEEYQHEEDSIVAKYQIVLGVYQLVNYAKEFQKFLEKQIKIKTLLVQLADHPKKYIYVCTPKEYNFLAEALNELKGLQAIILGQELEITRGDVWILQTLKN